MKSKTFERRLRRLEKVFLSEDDWIDSIIWNIGVPVGCFGHTHYRFSESKQQTEWVPCSVDEELERMRWHYENYGHKISVREPKVSFVKYLEYHCYLGPENLAEERRALIERVRSEESGAGAEGSSC